MPKFFRNACSCSERVLYAYKKKFRLAALNLESDAPTPPRCLANPRGTLSRVTLRQAHPLSFYAMRVRRILGLLLLAVCQGVIAQSPSSSASSGSSSGSSSSAGSANATSAGNATASGNVTATASGNSTNTTATATLPPLPKGFVDPLDSHGEMLAVCIHYSPSASMSRIRLASR